MVTAAAALHAALCCTRLATSKPEFFDDMRRKPTYYEVLKLEFKARTTGKCKGHSYEAKRGYFNSGVVPNNNHRMP